MPSEAQVAESKRRRPGRGADQYEKIMDEVLRYAWAAAPVAMQAIAEAAADGDIGASYYIINRTLGRPPEAPKVEQKDDYSDVLRSLRELRTGSGGSQGAGAKPRGEDVPVEDSGVPAEPETVGGPHESEEAEADSGW